MQGSFHGLDLDSDSDDEPYAPSESDEDLEDSPHEDSEHLDETDYLRADLPMDEEAVAEKVLKALDELAVLGLNIRLLLELVSWGNAPCRSHPRIKAARTLFLKYRGLSTLLTKWCYPPRTVQRGKREDGARVAMDCLCDI